MPRERIEVPPPSTSVARTCANIVSFNCSRKLIGQTTSWSMISS